MSWSLKDLKIIVENKYNLEQAQLLSPSLDSISKKFVIAEYHFHEFKKLLDICLKDKKTKKDTLQLFISWEKSEERKKFYYYKIRAEANALGSVDISHR